MSSCLRNRRILFVGDSTIRQVFWAAAELLNHEFDHSTISEWHQDAEVKEDGIRLQFVWDPYLNSTRLKSELLAYADRGVGHDAADKPALTFVGAGLWHAQNVHVNPLKHWKDSIDDVAKYMVNRRGPADYTDEDHLMFLSPVSVPVWGRLEKEKRENIKPITIEAMNQYLLQLSYMQGIDVFRSHNLMIRASDRTRSLDGIHVTPSVATWKLQTLLNLRCNSRTVDHYPYDGTCCIKYTAPDTAQFLLLITVMAFLPIVFLSGVRASKRRGRFGLSSGAAKQSFRARNAGWLPTDNVIKALLVVGTVIVYSFYADRTQIFNKVSKSFDHLTFLFLVLLAGGAGLKKLERSSNQASGFLNRDQTDEWKGWMQAVVLIYHYTGASKTLWIYIIIRLLVASYLFMTGYGHAMYFLRKGDFSLSRVASVLLRLNLLSIALAYMMNTAYSFYYFAPLVSFWFLVVYITLRVSPQRNSNPKSLLIKIAVSAIITTLLILIPGIFELIASILHAIFRLEIDVHEWRFRLALDLFIVYAGVLLAARTLQSSGPIFPQTQAAKFAAAAILPGYVLFACIMGGKENYNCLHPFLSWLPILAFVHLRNSSSVLQGIFSSLFAELGKISLETFTLQFHIWMASDTHALLDFGILSLGRAKNGEALPLISWWWWINLAAVSVVFIFVARKVADYTPVLVSWLLGDLAPRGGAALPVRREANGAGEEKELELGSGIDLSKLEREEEAVEPLVSGPVGSGRVRLAAFGGGLWLLNWLS